MVHRPPDSRLLNNLLLQDKEYSKQFYTLLNAASASASSLSAYAAASAPPASHIILTVAGSLATADDALRRYASSIDEWREQLKGLKSLEDEVTNILRDREILVTRVIKASRHKQSSGAIRDLHRSSQYPSSSSLSTNKSEFTGKSAVAGSSKLAHAQSELQACEAHLAAKERELAIRRCAIVKTGLDVRFRAMIDCGWAWGEIGKEALATLEELATLTDEQLKRPALAPAASAMDIQPSRPSSDLSSIGPSQSASQINVPPPAHNSILGILYPSASEPVASVGQPPRSSSSGLERREERSNFDEPDHMTMTIPPAHAINEVDLPMAVSSNHLPSPPPSNAPSNASHDVPPIRSASSTSVKSLPISHSGDVFSRDYGTEEPSYGMKRHVLSRRITEEDIEEQHQDAYYSPIPFKANESSSDDGHRDENLTVVNNPRFVKGKKNGGQYDTEKSTKQERRGSLFGSLRGLFGHSKSGKVVDQREHGHGGLGGLFGGKKNKWDTRAERNLRKMDKEDLEDRQLASRVARLNSPPRPGARLRRASDATGSRVSLRFVDGNIVMGDGGYEDVASIESDGGPGRRRIKRGNGTGPEAKLTRKRSSSVPPVLSAAAGSSRYAEERVSAVSGPRQRAMSPTSVASGSVSRPPLPNGALSRSSSIVSAASAPVVSRANKSSTSNRGQVARRASVGEKKEAEGGERMAGHVRSSSNPVGLSKGRDGTYYFAPAVDATTTTSLMSIVENVARANKNAAEKLKQKENISMTNLLAFDRYAADTEESLLLPASSSTLTVRPDSVNGGPIRSLSPLSASGAVEPKIFIPKAPQSISKNDLEVLEREGELQTKLRGNTQRVEEIVSMSVQSPPHTPEKQKTGARQGRELAVHAPRRPAQSPLRSALRNPNSRSASPAPAPVAGPSRVNGRPVENGLAHSVTATMPGGLDDLFGKKEQKRGGKNGSYIGHDNDETASVSSYETGHEVPIEEDVTESSPGTAAKNPMGSILKDSTTHNGKLETNAGARITSPPPESVLSGTPQRRKSVRVSLQPTFSPSPPAIYDDENEERNGSVPSKSVRAGKQLDNVKVNGWTGGRRREDRVGDIWENSSDEDEEYANAKQLLSRMSSSVGNLRKGW